MDEPILNPEELAAIRKTVGEATASIRPIGLIHPEQVSPLPLIAEDRLADRARPVAFRFGQRLGKLLPARLRRLCGVVPNLVDVASETIDVASLRDTFSHPLQFLVDSKPARGAAAVGLSGPWIEAIAARLLGATSETNAPDRPPSATTLRIFTPAFEAMQRCIDEAWHHDTGGSLSPSGADVDEWIRAIETNDVVMAVRLKFEEPTGSVWLLTRPDLFVSPKAASRVVTSAPNVVRRALADVPAEVTVEIGHAKMSMRDLRSLRVGEVVPLYQTIDGLMQIAVGGVPKGYGKASVSNGAFAIEVTRIHQPEKK